MKGIDSGDTAWMLAATALVLLMTPALGLFYAGLVRSRNTLNTFMMCAAALAVATWLLHDITRTGGNTGTAPKAYLTMNVQVRTCDGLLAPYRSPTSNAAGHGHG